jgi:hypothetical protein
LYAEETYEPSDPIAAVDGEPIYLGELNLILSQRFKSSDLDSVPMQVQQATAAILVRRHLAMKSLREQGGEAIEAMISRQRESFATEARRRGSSLADQAKARKADEKSLHAELAWQTVWGQYLKSTLSDKNLRLYYEKNASRYGGGRWEVSQVFIKMDPADTDSIKATAAQLTELADEIRQSGSIPQAFAEAAREHSQGGTASEGGKVGWVEKDGDLPGRVMKAVREATIGEIAGPIQSPMGLHLILVHQGEVGKRTFEQLTDQAQLRRDATDALFDALVAKQKNAKVSWFISALQPPPGIQLVP